MTFFDRVRRSMKADAAFILLSSLLKTVIRAVKPLKEIMRNCYASEELKFTLSDNFRLQTEFVNVIFDKHSLVSRQRHRKFQHLIRTVNKFADHLLCDHSEVGAEDNWLFFSNFAI